MRVRPTLAPMIEQIAPPVVAFGAGARLTISGAQFGDSAQARFGVRIASSERLPDVNAVRVVLPDGLRAGVNAVRIVIPDPDGGAAPLAESPEALFVLQPRVADGAASRAQDGAHGTVVIVNLAPLPGLAQPVQLFLNPLAPAAPGATPAGSATPLRFSIDGVLAAELDRGGVTAELRQTFAANGVGLGPGARIAADGTERWRVIDGANLCRLARDGERIAVHHGLAADHPDGTIAFAVDDLAPGRYLVAVQIGEEAAATSALRWGRRVFEQPMAQADPADAAMVAAVRAGMQANGRTLPPNAEAVRPIPGDGWEIRVGGEPTYWARHQGGTLAVFELDTEDSGYFGPLVTVPAGRLPSNRVSLD